MSQKTTYLLFKLLVVCEFMSTCGSRLLSFQSKGNDLKEKKIPDINAVPDEKHH